MKVAKRRIIGLNGPCFENGGFTNLDSVAQVFQLQFLKARPDTGPYVLTNKSENFEMCKKSRNGQ